MIDPKARSMLQEQVSKIQHNMMDRALYVFSLYEESNDVEKLQYFDTLMKLYNKYTEVLVHDILIPLDNPANQTPMNSSTFANIVRRLNKGYANFVYDTTKSRLEQFIAEEEQKKNLNDKENQEQNPEEDEGVID